ncbi:MAG TPA: GNAT family N-acetyltransferase, partial [Verrucomicrobiales bacterium]|nr:GNAT family N-acetyltransferase [Verrucomicrobiales bacterium]
TMPGHTVRRAVEADLGAANQLCRSIHGHDRGQELLEAIRRGTATVVERHRRITGYATAIGFFAHAVAESDDDLKALIAAATEFTGPGFLLPTRNAEVFRWCLEQGLQVVQPMTLMSIGLYNDPQGAFLPSILF